MYSSIDLHFRESSQQWECVEYLGFDSDEGDMKVDAGYFNVEDDDVVVAYGYQAWWQE